MARSKSILRVLVLPALFAAIVSSQTRIHVSGPVVSDDMDHAKSVLKRHHIAITEKAVAAAFQGTDFEIRWAAAVILVERWPGDAISVLRDALHAERDELSRVKIASHLARLGDNEGRDALAIECHRQSDAGSTRMFAARELFQLKETSCKDSVLEILRLQSDPNDTFARSDALDSLPDFFDQLGPREAAEALEAVASALQDPAVSVRISASHALVRLKDTKAIPQLEAALAKEPEPELRNWMSADLKSLREIEQQRRSETQ